MSRTKPELCYMCPTPKHSKEHVPAKAFFPAKDDGGYNYREKLETVPSCKKHNELYSTDDEYVASIMKVHFVNNEVAHEDFDAKVLRSIEKNPSKLDWFLKDNKPVYFVPPGKKLGELAYTFTVDQKRIDRVMQKIAFALHYKITGYRAAENTEFFVYSPQTFFADTLESRAPLDFESHIGSANNFTSYNKWNTKIFQCDYWIDLARNCFVFRLTFYQHFEYRIIGFPPK